MLPQTVRQPQVRHYAQMHTAAGYAHIYAQASTEACLVHAYMHAATDLARVYVQARTHGSTHHQQAEYAYYTRALSQQLDNSVPCAMIDIFRACVCVCVCMCARTGLVRRCGRVFLSCSVTNSSQTISRGMRQHAGMFTHTHTHTRRRTQAHALTGMQVNTRRHTHRRARAQTDTHTCKHRDTHTQSLHQRGALADSVHGPYAHSFRHALAATGVQWHS